MKSNEHIHETEKTMTKDEFNAWMKLTKFSEKKWVLDEIRWANDGELLWYKGGVDGTYIWITPNAYVEGKPNSTIAIGEYKGAIPHIMEAEFTPKHSGERFGDVNAASKYVLERLGVAFLLEWLV